MFVSSGGVTLNADRGEESGPEVHLDDLLGMLKSSSATQKQIGSTLPARRLLAMIRVDSGSAESSSTARAANAQGEGQHWRRVCLAGSAFVSVLTSTARSRFLKFLDKPGGRNVLVRDKDDEFETHLDRLIKPWSEFGPKDKESEFRTNAEKYAYERSLVQERDPVGFEIEESWRRLSALQAG